MSKILDNTTGKTVVGWLQDSMQKGDLLRFVSAYFSIYGYKALQGELESAKMRFLFGEPSNVGNVDPASQDEKSFTLEKDGLHADNDQLQQKWIAQECAEWVKKKTEIRTVEKSNFLHGKMYHLQHKGSDESQAVSGSSNFTKNGLGAAAKSNLELNLIADESTTSDLEKWFDALWGDEEQTRDAKDEVLQALSKIGDDKTPQFIYYKTLYHRFEDRLRLIEKNQDFIDQVSYEKTAIWKALFEFQRHGVIGAINRLQQHNGCIIADSVGLGKTYSALAIIKYFELRNENVLVLCPKRLSENWTRYQAAAGNKNNPFTEDKFQYHVLSHTDLGRKTGEVGSINLENFHWGNYSLVVIDESHNFRNAPSSGKKGDPNARRSRYQFLMEEVIKAKAHTKVLMLSATPVNNRLQDLRNQIMLFSDDNDNHFQESLDISSLKIVMQNAQRVFNEWQELPNKDRNKEKLLNRLDEQFFRILDTVTIARSRHHLTAFYPDFIKKVGGFPDKEKPINKDPATDSENELQYEDMVERIGKLNLAIYSPSEYLAADSDLNAKLEEEKETLNYNQVHREHLLIGMMRTNFFKRLESSVFAYRETLDRILLKIENMLGEIADHQDKGNFIRDAATEPDEDDTKENDEYTFGGKTWQYRLRDLNLPSWQEALEADKAALTAIREIAGRVTPDRDAKLAELRAAIADKITKPNRKVLIFTTFADTAKYLYEQLHEWAQGQGCHIGQIAGSDSIRTSANAKADYAEVLDRFAPHGRQIKLDGDEIDILIATDCISEGQNLQDCDLVINYDVHWNPVRIIQRFGRIDRLNSKNKSLSMINFWPNMEMEEYLNLHRRVLSRMELVNIAATGHENILEDKVKPKSDAEREKSEKEKGEQLELQLGHRVDQIKQLREGKLEMEQQQGDLDMSDFTLDDFIADLRAYMDKNGKMLENAPLGLFSLVPPHESGDNGREHVPGILFCLRRKYNMENPPEILPPCRLVYMKNDKTASLGNHALATLRNLARDRDQVESKLARWFDSETENGQKMDKENECIKRAIKKITEGERKSEAVGVSSGVPFAKSGEYAQDADDYELITWLIIRHPNP